MRHTPVAVSPARMGRSSGAPPRQRGSSEKWMFTIGRAASTCGLISLPKATTTPSSAPASMTSSTWSVTGSARSWAAALTGLGIKPPPRPRRLSARVTTKRTSCPSATRARRGGTAISGVPRNASFTGLGRLVRLCPVGGQPQGPLAERPHRLFAFVGLEPLQEEDAVEVVDLVLEHAGEKLVGVDLLVVPVDVDALEVHLLGTADVPPELGHRQAPLVVRPLAAVLGEHRID